MFFLYPFSYFLDNKDYMSNINVKNFITFSMLQAMDQHDCLTKLSPVNKEICCAIIKYINATKIQFLQQRQDILLSQTSLKSKKMKHLSFSIGACFFFDLHWSGLLLYGATHKHLSYEERRGTCIYKIVDELRTMGFRTKHALPLIKTILSFGLISSYQRTVAFASNISQIHPLRPCASISSLYEREIALVLMQSGDMQKNVGFFLAFAVEKNDVEMVQIFLQVVPDISSVDINQAYNIAVAINNEQIITILLPYVKNDKPQKEDCVIA